MRINVYFLTIVVYPTNSNINIFLLFPRATNPADMSARLFEFPVFHLIFIGAIFSEYLTAFILFIAQFNPF